MATDHLLLALGVPTGQHLMPDDTLQCGVLNGMGEWGLTPEEYRVWNEIFQSPGDPETMSPLAEKLLQDGALYRYDPHCPDKEFMRDHRVAPMGHPIGPLPKDPQQYLILSTNGRTPLACSMTDAQIWLHWWRGQALNEIDAFSLPAVWQAIPWALRNHLGYLFPCHEVLM